MNVIYHNPRCGTSRVALKLLEASETPVRMVEYLKEGWTRGQLLGLFAAADLTPAQALRAKETKARELGLTGEGVDDETILDAMVAHPVLVERPLVCTPKGVRLCRPSEGVLDLVEGPLRGPVMYENGKVILDENGDRAET